MTGSFWGTFAYGAILVCLLLIIIFLVFMVHDSWNKRQAIRQPLNNINDANGPFCAQVEITLKGEPLISPLFQQTCIHFSSMVTKHYTRKSRKSYYEAMQQVDYQMRLGEVYFLPPEPEKAQYLQPEYQYHKNWLASQLPVQLENSLRQLQLDETFWKGLTRTSIDFDEGILPVETHLWVYGRVQSDDEKNDSPLRLIGYVDGVPPLIATTYKQLSQQSLYDLVSYSSLTLGFIVFSLVAALVLR